jgi:hypothetical protein
LLPPLCFLLSLTRRFSPSRFLLSQTHAARRRRRKLTAPSYLPGLVRLSPLRPLQSQDSLLLEFLRLAAQGGTDNIVRPSGTSSGRVWTGMEPPLPGDPGGSRCPGRIQMGHNPVKRSRDIRCRAGTCLWLPPVISTGTSIAAYLNEAYEVTVTRSSKWKVMLICESVLGRLK